MIVDRKVFGLGIFENEKRALQEKQTSRDLSDIRSLLHQLPQRFIGSVPSIRGPITRVLCDRYVPGMGQLVEANRDFWVPETYFFLPQDGVIVKLQEGSSQEKRIRGYLHRVFQKMDGDEVERDYSKAERKGFVKHPLFWTDYWNGTDRESRNTYKKEIHPVVARYVVERIREAGRGFVWVDMFGGNGELVERVMRQTTSSNDVRFHIVDRNETVLVQADQRFNGKQVFVHKPMDFTVAGHVLVDGAEAADIVTAVGGLCTEVLSRDQSFAVAEKVSRDMKPGALFVVTGKSKVLLNANDFQSVGFTVLQMTIPKNVGTSKRPEQFYVLQKAA